MSWIRYEAADGSNAYWINSATITAVTATSSNTVVLTATGDEHTVRSFDTHAEAEAWVSAFLNNVYPE